ncbi:alpha/beta hydrolase, partial [Mesorhizobium sp.]|uniref:alpha/beta hydrolase n=1 Tax=Mesorhizobium sp. TaxID=1871066 RepID=UPI0025D731F0
MLVATSRKPSGDPATLFTGERSPALSLTDLTISIPPNRAPGTVEWPKKLPPNPQKDFAVLAARNLSVPEAHKWLHAHNSNGHVLVFVHGFNNRYEDSVFRFAQFVHDSRANVVPILFTWPSRASVLGYNYDKESANFSRTAFERTLKALADDRSVT